MAVANPGPDFQVKFAVLQTVFFVTTNDGLWDLCQQVPSASAPLVSEPIGYIFHQMLGV